MSKTPDLSTQENIPRDVKLLHLLFAANSIDAYEDHVPLQLMDFAHRYTVSMLKDAVVYSDHGNMSNLTMTNAGNTGAADKLISVDDIKLASKARLDYQFRNAQTRELFLELANEKNKKPLPNCIPSFGVRLPPEKYCFTGRDLELDEELKYEEEVRK